MQLLIATRNLHKIRELKFMLKRYGNIDVLSLIDFPSYEPPPETGESFKDNAVNKAIDAATKLNQWVLADDSGLVVPSLQGAPGVYSSRYSGEKATDMENRKKLLDEMKDMVDLHRRQAYLECCLAVASPKGIEKSVSGICWGLILFEERGSHGFGYDSLFLKYGYRESFGEIREDIKNQVSHRRKAVDKLHTFFEFLSR